MVKINLKALKNDAEAKEIQEEATEIKVDEAVLEVKKEEIETKAEKKSGVKISLKDLNLKPANDNSVEAKKVETKTEEIIETKAEEVEKTEEIIEAKIEEITSEEVVKEEVLKKKVETFAISDGDTNCNIIQDNKLEIFANYKGSYAPKPEKKKEDEKIEAVSEEVIEVKSEEKVLEETAEIVEIKNEETQAVSEEIVEIKAEEQVKEEIIENSTEEKTNLEKYKEGNNENKKIKNIFKNKKVIITSAFVFILAIAFGVISTLDFKKLPSFKANIQEIQGLKEPLLPKEELPKKVNEGMDNGQPNIMNEDLKEKVNENIQPNIDNNPKTNTMNNNIENYLIRKYKNN